MNVWATIAFHQAGAPIKPFAPCMVLVTQGICGYTRNPMYLWMLVILEGLWLSLGSLSPGLVFPPLVWVLQTRFIRAEERRLAESFLESSNPSIVRAGSRTTAAATTGPARGPRPTSSTPHTRAKPSS